MNAYCVYIEIIASVTNSHSRSCNSNSLLSAGELSINFDTKAHLLQ